MSRYGYWLRRPCCVNVNSFHRLASFLFSPSIFGSSECSPRRFGRLIIQVSIGSIGSTVSTVSTVSTGSTGSTRSCPSDRRLDRGAIQLIRLHRDGDGERHRVLRLSGGGRRGFGCIRVTLRIGNLSMLVGLRDDANGELFGPAAQAGASTSNAGDAQTCVRRSRSSRSSSSRRRKPAGRRRKPRWRKKKKKNGDEATNPAPPRAQRRFR